jgi:hypothetical protein
MNIIEAISNRRSVRKFMDKEIDRDIIESKMTQKQTFVRRYGEWLQTDRQIVAAIALGYSAEKPALKTQQWIPLLNGDEAPNYTSACRSFFSSKKIMAPVMKNEKASATGAA